MSGTKGQREEREREREKAQGEQEKVRGHSLPIGPFREIWSNFCAQEEDSCKTKPEMRQRFQEEKARCRNQCYNEIVVLCEKLTETIQKNAEGSVCTLEYYEVFMANFRDLCREAQGLSKRGADRTCHGQA